MQKNSYAPQLPFIKNHRPHSHLLDIMIDRFWKDTLQYLEINAETVAPACGVAGSKTESPQPTNT